ncbi:MAG: 4Fe-4S binding protein [Deltaproteobacteria bacterium]|nr:4Fe-4S binding protein [Deltaproteobacteria bacterium]
MQPERLPFSKIFDSPFISLDETSIEMASILFLFLAVVLIANVERRRQLIRHAVQVASFLVFYYFVYSCLGVFGMIRNGLYGMTLLGTVYSESFYWLALPATVIAVTLLMGPVFCSWICPTGTIQEAAGWARRRVLPKRAASGRLSLALLGVFLAAFIAITVHASLSKEMFIEDSSLHWAAALLLLCYLVVLGVVDDLPIRTLRLFSVLAILVTAVSHVNITSPMHFAFTARNDPASQTSTLVILLASMVVARSWCRYLCPWGYVMSVLHRLSRVKIAKAHDRCSGCHDCLGVCDVDAVTADGVRHEHCQLCYACIDGCKTGALTLVDVWQRPPTKGLPVLPGPTAASADAERRARRAK